MPSKLNQFPKALAIVRRYFPKVKEVADADSPITIEVTDRDSKSAAVRNHESCAMAVACKRKAKADGVIVSIATAYIIKGDVAYRYRVPSSVQREIVSFDRDAGFAAGNYELATIVPSNKLGESKSTGPHKTTGKPRQVPHQTTGIRAVLGSKE